MLDPVLVATDSKVRGLGPSKFTADTKVTNLKDASFPMSVGKAFSITYHQDSHDSLGHTSSRDVERKCVPDAKVLLSVPAGNYDVFPIKCAETGLDSTGIYTSYYSKSRGVSVKTESDIDTKLEGGKIGHTHILTMLQSIE